MLNILYSSLINKHGLTFIRSSNFDTSLNHSTVFSGHSASVFSSTMGHSRNQSLRVGVISFNVTSLTIFLSSCSRRLQKPLQMTSPAVFFATLL